MCRGRGTSCRRATDRVALKTDRDQGTMELLNNLWVLLAGLLVFSMTASVGLLEVGELGRQLDISLRKTLLISGLSLVVMALIGFNIAFAPTWGGWIGNPLYAPGLGLGAFSDLGTGTLGAVWWSMGPGYFATGLTTGTYFFFETAFASVTLALVGVVLLTKVKLEAFLLYAVAYFAIIWTLPAAWIWNPSGWLARLGMVDFAGGLVVHAAAGAAGLGILAVVWSEERARGYRSSPPVVGEEQSGWLTLALVLLWLGWFGFNPGSVLAFNSETVVVALTTFLAAAAAMISLWALRRVVEGSDPGLRASTDGVLMGLIVITPLAGFVSPSTALIVGALAGPVYFLADRSFGRVRWFSDPIGLMPGHFVGGLFGILLIAFVTQSAFAGASGYPNLVNGLLFGGGLAALRQLGVEVLGTLAVMATVFTLSYLVMRGLSRALGGITQDYSKVGLPPP